uniref:Transcription elongation factor spt6 n=1 Tax=Compsopogon caeruleus TaxID=31354 RepID=A0A7S1XEN5_9RHOD
MDKLFRPEGDEQSDEDTGVVARQKSVERRRDDDATQPTQGLSIEVLDSRIADGQISSPFDVSVRDKDLPEFVQVHFANRRPLDERALAEEANWITKMAFTRNRRYHKFTSEEVVQKISAFLKFLHVDKLDIPFIAVYRREYVEPVLVSSEEVPLDPEIDGKHPWKWTSPAMACSPRVWNTGIGDWTGLWTVVEWDKKYGSLMLRRQEVEETLSVAKGKGVSGDIIEEVRSKIDALESEAEASDYRSYLAHHLSILDHRNPSKRKVRGRQERYCSLVDGGLDTLASQIGISAMQFSENITKMYQRHIPDDDIESPISKGIEWVERHPRFASTLETSDAVASDEIRAEKALEGARYLLATDLMVEPGVVSHIRLMVQSEKVRISSIPTMKGMSDVDDFHPLRRFVSVDGMKLNDLEANYDFLMLKKAEELGYTRLSVALPPDAKEELMSELNGLYCSQSYHETAEKWNTQRRKVLEIVVDNLLQNLFRELQRELTERSELALRLECGRLVDFRLSLGPMLPEVGSASSESTSWKEHCKDEIFARNLEAALRARRSAFDTSPRILAFSLMRPFENEEAEDPVGPYVKKERGLTFVMAGIDADGEVLDASGTISAQWIRRSSNSSLPPEVVELVEKEFKRVRPHMLVIGLGRGGKDALNLSQDIYSILTDLWMREGDASSNESWRSWFDQGLNGREPAEILGERTLFVEDEPAHLYSMTSLCRTHLPEFSQPQRRCIALARFCQEPLGIYATIGLDVEASTAFRIHPDQDLVPRDQRRECLRRALVRAVCSTGLDVNRALSHPHLRPCLSFVGGLGPRKASGIWKKLEQMGSRSSLESRKDLLMKGVVEPKVFVSSSGFLRIRDSDSRRASKQKKGKKRGKKDSIQYHPLDDTRIHPEVYPVAVKIAEDALRDDDNDEAPPAGGALRVTALIMEDVNKLETLDLEYYADHLEQVGKGKMKMTISMIKNEYKNPYGDSRQPLLDPDVELRFYLATGLDRSATRRGAKVIARDLRPYPPDDTVDSIPLKVNCNVWNMRAEIRWDNLAKDDRIRLERKNAPELAAVVLSVNWEKFSFDLSALEDDVRNPNGLDGVPKPLNSSYSYSIRPYSLWEKKEAKSVTRQMALEKRRPVSADVARHPYFQPINSKEAENHLTEKCLPGDVVLFPGKSKLDFYISMKIADHVPIYRIGVRQRREGNKDRFTVPTVDDLSEEFDTIDELLGRHVAQIMQNFLDVKEHRKFVEGGEQGGDEYCHQERLTKGPKSIPYCIGYSAKYVGYLVISYLPSQKTVRREYVRVLPEGYRFRKSKFPRISRMLEFFKTVWMTTGHAGALEASRPRAAVLPSIQSRPSFEQGRASGAPIAAEAGWGPPRGSQTPLRTPQPPPSAPPPTAVWGEQPDRERPIPNSRTGWGAFTPRSPRNLPDLQPSRSPGWGAVPPNPRSPRNAWNELQPPPTSNPWAPPERGPWDTRDSWNGSHQPPPPQPPPSHPLPSHLAPFSGPIRGEGVWNHRAGQPPRRPSGGEFRGGGRGGPPRGRDDDRSLPSWRGQAPVPAWQQSQY